MITANRGPGMWRCGAAVSNDGAEGAIRQTMTANRQPDPDNRDEFQHPNNQFRMSYRKRIEMDSGAAIRVVASELVAACLNRHAEAAQTCKSSRLGYRCQRDLGEPYPWVARRGPCTEDVAHETPRICAGRFAVRHGGRACCCSHAVLSRSQRRGDETGSCGKARCW